jgi:hypothetical protein
MTANHAQLQFVLKSNLLDQNAFCCNSGVLNFFVNSMVSCNVSVIQIKNEMFSNIKNLHICELRFTLWELCA